METINQAANAQSTQTEVTLRTLSSDLQSMQHGEPAPTGQVIRVAALDEPVAKDETPRAPSHIGKTIFMSLVLIAIVAIGYLYLYPKVKEAFTGTVTQ